MSNQTQKIIVRILVAVNNEILLLKRSSHRSRSSEWEFPGGKVDFGEDFQQAAQRELLEETGLKSAHLEFFDTFSHVEQDVHSLGVIYKASLAVLPEIALSDEHQEYTWAGTNNWRKLSLVAEYEAFFMDYFSSKKEENVDSTTSVSTDIKLDEAIVFADGGSRGNPGPSATGYAIYDQNESEVARGGEYIGITTNNQAEYLAVKQGLVHAKELGVKKITFYLDSMLVVNQMKGIYKVKNKDLWPVHESIKQLASDMEVEFVHVRREKNKVADSIVNEVLDNHQNQQ